MVVLGGVVVVPVRLNVTSRPGTRLVTVNPAPRHMLTWGRSPDHQARWFVAEAGSPPTTVSSSSQVYRTESSAVSKASMSERQSAMRPSVPQARAA